MVLLEFPEETLGKQQLQPDSREVKKMDCETLWQIDEQQDNDKLFMRMAKKKRKKCFSFLQSFMTKVL